MRFIEWSEMFLQSSGQAASLKFKEQKMTAKHQHKAIPSKTKEHCWITCVTPAECAAHSHRQVAHGNIVRFDRCACGATRRSEINAGRTNYGRWEVAE